MALPPAALTAIVHRQHCPLLDFHCSQNGGAFRRSINVQKMHKIFSVRNLPNVIPSWWDFYIYSPAFVSLSLILPPADVKLIIIITPTISWSTIPMFDMQSMPNNPFDQRISRTRFTRCRICTTLCARPLIKRLSADLFHNLYDQNKPAELTLVAIQIQEWLRQVINIAQGLIS